MNSVLVYLKHIQRRYSLAQCTPLGNEGGGTYYISQQMLEAAAVWDLPSGFFATAPPSLGCFNLR